MSPVKRLVSAVLLSLAASAPALAADDEVATPADAAERLKAIVGLVKAKGPAGAGQQIMAADDPLKCKYRDMSCMLLTIADATFVANTAVPKLVGQQFPMDMADVDGTPIIGQQLGPAKQGKLKWEAKFKFVRPGTKKVVPRWAFCEKADDAHVACVVVAQQ